MGEMEDIVRKIVKEELGVIPFFNTEEEEKRIVKIMMKVADGNIDFRNILESKITEMFRRIFK